MQTSNCFYSQARTKLVFKRKQLPAKVESQQITTNGRPQMQRKRSLDFKLKTAFSNLFSTKVRLLSSEFQKQRIKWISSAKPLGLKQVEYELVLLGTTFDILLEQNSMLKLRLELDSLKRQKFTLVHQRPQIFNGHIIKYTTTNQKLESNYRVDSSLISGFRLFKDCFVFKARSQSQYNQQVTFTVIRVKVNREQLLFSFTANGQGQVSTAFGRSGREIGKINYCLNIINSTASFRRTKMIRTSRKQSTVCKPTQPRTTKFYRTKSLYLGEKDEDGQSTVFRT